MASSKRRKLPNVGPIDNDDFNADWTKVKYDLGFKTLRELAEFLDMDLSGTDFRRWLKRANAYAWVDNAPPEIRIAIRAHR